MSRRPALLGLALAALALVVYLVASPGAPPPVEAAPSAEPVAPSAENVDPGVHAEMMRLKGAAEAAPDDLAAQLAFARMALGAHRGAEAAEALERAVALDPEARQPWLDLALAYGAAEDWDATAEASRRMLARFPDDAEAQYNLGAAFANAGKLTDARAAWESVPQASAMGSQAATSLAQLAAMESAPATAPPLPDGQTALPPGHPPIAAASSASGCTSGTCAEGGDCSGSCAGGCGCGGLETRVVDGGVTDARPLHAFVSALAEKE